MHLDGLSIFFVKGVQSSRQRLVYLAVSFNLTFPLFFSSKIIIME